MKRNNYYFYFFHFIFLFFVLSCGTNHSNQDTDTNLSDEKAESRSSNSTLQLQNRIIGLEIGNAYAESEIKNAIANISNGKYTIRVDNYSNSKEYLFVSTEDYNPTIEVGVDNFSFGGYKWNIIFLDFDNHNNLYQVEFRSVDSQYNVKDRFDKLSNTLISKYGEPCRKRNNYLMWENGVIQIQLRNNIGLISDISLAYYDLITATSVVINNNSEL